MVENDDGKSPSIACMKWYWNKDNIEIPIVLLGKATYSEDLSITPFNVAKDLVLNICKEELKKRVIIPNEEEEDFEEQHV
jgi:hypothetical protein